jgi:DNA-binding NtrC family response regulator
LNVYDIHIPPLRERRDDILPLAAGFLREFAGATAELTREAMEALRRHNWPGNVRELRNVLERALIMCDGRVIDVEQAYESDSSGKFEIYVKPFPNVSAGQWLVSTAGGTRPLWAPNGQELFLWRPMARSWPCVSTLAVPRGGRAAR